MNFVWLANHYNIKNDNILKDLSRKANLDLFWIYKKNNNNNLPLNITIEILVGFQNRRIMLLDDYY